MIITWGENVVKGESLGKFFLNFADFEIKERAVT